MENDEKEQERDLFKFIDPDGTYECLLTDRGSKEAYAMFILKMNKRLLQLVKSFREFSQEQEKARLNGKIYEREGEVEDLRKKIETAVRVKILPSFSFEDGEEWQTAMALRIDAMQKAILQIKEAKSQLIELANLPCPGMP